jgi:hypothetical protein
MSGRTTNTCTESVHSHDMMTSETGGRCHLSQQRPVMPWLDETRCSDERQPNPRLALRFGNDQLSHKAAAPYSYCEYSGLSRG